MTKEQEQLKKSWLQIMAILKETGYDYLYMEDISRVASVIRKEIGLDKCNFNISEEDRREISNRGMDDAFEDWENEFENRNI